MLEFLPISAFLRVLIQLVLVVAFMLAVSTAVVVGRERLVKTRQEVLARLRAAAPVTVFLATVLMFNGVAREVVPDLSWLLERRGAWNLTWEIYEFEGEFIIWLQQEFQHPVVTAYFSFTYIYGYVFILIFPVIAYFALSDTRPLRELFAAYALNYLLGLILYVLVVAYGPRNVIPELVQGLLYETYPSYQHLTRQVNRNTNVFPSLHTSLSVTVALFAYRTRDTYPRWFPVAVVLATSVAISTMYLGIHWATDVVAGAVLAVVAVALSTQLVGRWSVTDLSRRALGRAKVAAATIRNRTD